MLYLILHLQQIKLLYLQGLKQNNFHLYLKNFKLFNKWMLKTLREILIAELIAYAKSLHRKVSELSFPRSNKKGLTDFSKYTYRRLKKGLNLKNPNRENFIKEYIHYSQNAIARLNDVIDFFRTFSDDAAPSASLRGELKNEKYTD